MPDERYARLRGDTRRLPGIYRTFTGWERPSGLPCITESHGPHAERVSFRRNSRRTPPWLRLRQPGCGWRRPGGSPGRGARAACRGHEAGRRSRQPRCCPPAGRLPCPARCPGLPIAPAPAPRMPVRSRKLAVGSLMVPPGASAFALPCPQCLAMCRQPLVGTQGKSTRVSYTWNTPGGGRFGPLPGVRWTRNRDRASRSRGGTRQTAGPASAWLTSGAELDGLDTRQVTVNLAPGHREPGAGSRTTSA